MTNRRKRFYERFKSEKIDSNQLNKAKKMAFHLGKISPKFLLLVRMINSNIKGEFKISLVDKAKLIGAIVYVITPTDALWDILPLFGFTDDAAVVMYVIGKLSSLISEYEKFEADKIESEKNPTGNFFHDSKKSKNVNADDLKVVNED